jgi:Arc/MetJ-type ribon-helix-helix transcriptional regulator
MKLSVSLPDADITFLDEYATQVDAASRSAVIHDAITLLRQAHLEHAYTEAWQEWEGSEDAALWDQATADGLTETPTNGPGTDATR